MFFTWCIASAAGSVRIATTALLILVKSLPAHLRINIRDYLRNSQHGSLCTEQDRRLHQGPHRQVGARRGQRERVAAVLRVKRSVTDFEHVEVIPPAPSVALGRSCCKLIVSTLAAT